MKCQVKSESGEKNLQSFGQSTGGIVSEKRTDRGHQERSPRSTIGKQAPRHVGDQKTSGEIEPDLHEQDGTKIVQSEEGENDCEECGVSREARKRRDEVAGICDCIGAVLQPVLGDVGVQAGVVHHGGKTQHQEEAQSQCRKTQPGKEARVLSNEPRHQFRHGAHDSAFAVVPAAQKLHL